MSEIKLKRCPFCGGEAKLEINREMGGTQYQVLCTKCPTTVGRYWFWKKEDAINSWNTRKPMQEIVERLEEEYRSLFEARMKLAEKMDTDKTAFDRARILQNKGMSIFKAIATVKEVGGMNE